MSKFVSFIAPMYNMAKYIVEFIESFAALPASQFELIIVDNGSTDNSVALINQHHQTNIKVVSYTEKSGPGGARNEGMKHIAAHATHFVFIDPDDKLIADFDVTRFLALCDDQVKVNANQLEGFTDGIQKNQLPRNLHLQGSHYNVVGGNIYPVFVKQQFMAGFYEDFGGIAAVTRDHDFKLIDYPFVQVRRSKSSITNSIANHPERLSDFRNEIFRIGEQHLVDRSTSAKSFLAQGLFDVYVLEGYARGFSNIQGDHRFDFLHVSRQKVFGTVFFQKLIGFGGGYAKFGMRHYFD